eukprot:252654_1
MKALQQQFAETERQRKMQQMMLSKHYEHQKEIMQNRHEELLRLKNRLLVHDISAHENHQIEHEEKLQRRHEQLLEIQNDYDLRAQKTQSNRKLLEDRKKVILQEMKKFDDLTQHMSKLNLDDTKLTDKQKSELDEFVAKHPESMVNNYEYTNYDEWRHSGNINNGIKANKTNNIGISKSSHQSMEMDHLISIGRHTLSESVVVTKNTVRYVVV